MPKRILTQFDDNIAEAHSFYKTRLAQKIAFDLPGQRRRCRPKGTPFANSIKAEADDGKERQQRRQVKRGAVGGGGTKNDDGDGE